MIVNRIMTIGLLLLVFTAGCSEWSVEEEDNSDIKLADFNAIWSIVDVEYPFLEFKGIDWQGIYNEYEPRIIRSQGDEYLDELVNLLGELKDGHVRFESKAGFIETYKLPRELKDRLSYDPELVRSYFKNELMITGDDHINYGIIDEAIGYIRINTWEENGRRWPVDIDKALSEMQSTVGLIIDVRHNTGGCICLSNLVTQRFLDEPLGLPGVIRRGELHEEDTLRPFVRIPYLKKVVVLINGATFSAAEVFARDMKTIDRVMLIGDTTAGAGGAVHHYDLPSKNKLRLTFQNSLRYDMTPIEWNGIEPDIVVSQTRGDVKNGTDKQLEFSIEYLKQ